MVLYGIQIYNDIQCQMHVLCMGYDHVDLSFCVICPCHMKGLLFEALLLMCVMCSFETLQYLVSLYTFSCVEYLPFCVSVNMPRGI